MVEINTLQCDITGEHGATRIPFAVKDVLYEIDLSSKSEDEFLGDLKRWINNARIVSPAGVKRVAAKQKKPRPVKRTNGSAPSKRNYDEVRKWAAANGKNIAARGRIKKETIAEFDAAQEEAAKAVAVN